MDGRDDRDGKARAWPEDDEAKPPLGEPSPGRARRVARALGDAGLTIGMGKDLAGGRDNDPARLLQNAMLVDEATAKGRAANKGSTGD